MTNILSSSEPLGIGYIIELTEDWDKFKSGQELKIILVTKCNYLSCFQCSGCIQCEGWEKYYCMVKKKDFLYRNFKIVSKTGTRAFKEGRDIINIVGMI